MEPYYDSDDYDYDELDNDDLDDGFDDEFDDPDDYSIECPNCGADVFDDADYCSRCGEFIIHSAGPSAGLAPIWKVVAILLLVLFVLGIAFGRFL